MQQQSTSSCYYNAMQYYYDHSYLSLSSSLSPSLQKLYLGLIIATARPRAVPRSARSLHSAANNHLQESDFSHFPKVHISKIVINEKPTLFSLFIQSLIFTLIKVEHLQIHLISPTIDHLKNTLLFNKR